MGSRDGGVSTETGFQDRVMDKHILFLKKQTDVVSDEELRVNPGSQRRKWVVCCQPYFLTMLGQCIHGRGTSVIQALGIGGEVVSCPNPVSDSWHAA